MGSGDAGLAAERGDVSEDHAGEGAPLSLRLLRDRRLQIIRELCGDVRGLDVAEVGAGGGLALRMFRDARLTAIDVSPTCLSIARKNLAGYDARFLEGELDKLDLPSASFDRVICSDALERAPDADAVLATVARVLRPYGVAVIIAPNDPLIDTLAALARRAPLSRALRDHLERRVNAPRARRFTPSALAALLERHFRVTDRRSAPFDALPLRACVRCVKRA